MPINFDGIDQFVNVGGTSDYEIIDDITITGWIFHESSEGPDSPIGKGLSFSLNCAWKIRVTGNDQLIFESNDSTTGTDELTTTTAPITLNAWKHFACVRSSGNRSIYIDGVLLVGPTAQARTPVGNGDPVVIGDSDVLGSEPFDGAIEDCRIYDRALSSAEILTIFTLEGRDNIIHGLIGRWTLNEKHPGSTVTVAGSVKDISVSGNDGSPGNTPVYSEGILAFGRRAS